MQVNIHEAKTHFSKLVDSALHGEEVIIARAGKPMLKLVSIEPAKAQRTPGLSRGKVHASPDYDGPLDDDILEEFEK